MSEIDLCCIGHITLDKVVTPKDTVYMPGGTSFYCSKAIKNLSNINYKLVASLAKSEWNVIEDLQQLGIDALGIESPKSLYFENYYGENQNDRSQKVLAKAKPFSTNSLEGIKSKVFFLGALTSEDFSLDFLKKLSVQGLIAVDAQGYLREIVNQQVIAVDWKDKFEFLKHITFLKVNEMELEILTHEQDIKLGAKKLYDWGVKEVIMTFGDLGSVVYDGSSFHTIPAYIPNEIKDATGCGDTYMTGYLYKRVKGDSIENSGKFGAAMATIKIEKSGPFEGTEKDILERINFSRTNIPKV